MNFQSDIDFEVEQLNFKRPRKFQTKLLLNILEKENMRNLFAIPNSQNYNKSDIKSNLRLSSKCDLKFNAQILYQRSEQNRKSYTPMSIMDINCFSHQINKKKNEQKFISFERVGVSNLKKLTLDCKNRQKKIRHKRRISTWKKSLNSQANTQQTIRNDELNDGLNSKLDNNLNCKLYDNLNSRLNDSLNSRLNDSLNSNLNDLNNQINGCRSKRTIKLCSRILKTTKILVLTKQQIQQGCKIRTHWHKNRINGYTEIDYQDGAKFKGLFQLGKMVNGQFIFNNGFIYNGHFHKFTFHGHGKLKFPQGHIFSGNWTFNTLIGIGTIIYPKGQIYQGNIVDFHKQGQGKLIFVNGDYYQGQFRKGQITGYGTLVKTNKTHICGYWIQGKYIKEDKQLYESLKQQLQVKKQANIKELQKLFNHRNIRNHLKSLIVANPNQTQNEISLTSYSNLSKQVSKLSINSENNQFLFD